MWLEIGVVVLVVAALVAGALIYRNNQKRVDEVVDKVKDKVDEVKNK